MAVCQELRARPGLKSEVLEHTQDFACLSGQSSEIANVEILMYQIGTSGWNYQHWKGSFYPEDLVKKNWFSYYSEKFSTVEINYSFYSWPSEETIKRWKKESPEKFIFTLKAPRIITHRKKLRNISAEVRRFFELFEILGKKRGCVLFQLPPSFDYNDENLDRVRKLFSKFEKKRDYAIEFREKKWWNPETYKLCRKFGVAFCSVSGLDMPEEFILTSDVGYFRFHGERYGGDYDKETLRRYAEFISRAKCRRVYCYFNNDAEGFAPKNALELKREVENA